MASDDYYTHLARQQLQRLDANKAQTLADLEAAKANSDYDCAGTGCAATGRHRSQKAKHRRAAFDQYVRVSRLPEPLGINARGKGGKADRTQWITATVWRCRATSQIRRRLDTTIPCWHG